MCADLEGVIAVVVFLSLVMGMSERGECSEAHGHQLDEEEHKDGHERYSFGPVVVCYRTGKAWVCKGSAGRSEEVDECCGYDDAGAKVFGNEEGPFWDARSSMSTRVDRESGTCMIVSDQVVNALEDGCLNTKHRANQYHEYG